MKKIMLAFLVILFPLDANSENPATTINNLIENAISLKKAHVEREWTGCMAQVANETRCKKLISLLWQQEKSVLVKLAKHYGNIAINQDALYEQVNACYDPTGDYTSLIKCWERLDVRVQGALVGQTLISRD